MSKHGEPPFDQQEILQEATNLVARYRNDRKRAKREAMRRQVGSVSVSGKLYHYQSLKALDGSLHARENPACALSGIRREGSQC